MKKWLRSIGVYVLGVATIPAALLMGTVASKNLWSQPHKSTLFVDGPAEPQIHDAFKAEAAQANSLADLDEVPVVFSTKSVGRKSNVPNSQIRPQAQPDLDLRFDEAVAEPLILADNSPRNGGTKAPQRTALDDDIGLETPSRLPPQRVVPKRDSAPLPNDGIESLAEATVSDEQKAKLTTLREKLGELIKAKAELINEQTLTNEISAIEKQISDLHAAQKLLNAQQILKSMIEEFPQSPAAQKAQRMLDAAGVGGTAPKPVAMPDFR